MAFENVTLFEVYVDGTEFGAFFGGDDEAVDEVVEMGVDDESVEMDAVAESEMDARPGTGRKGRYVALFGLAVVGSMLVRRVRRRRAAGEPIDVDVDGTDAVAVDETATHEEPAEQ